MGFPRRLKRSSLRPGSPEPVLVFRLSNGQYGHSLFVGSGLTEMLRAENQISDAYTTTQPRLSQIALNDGCRPLNGGLVESVRTEGTISVTILSQNWRCGLSQWQEAESPTEEIASTTGEYRQTLSKMAATTLLPITCGLCDKQCREAWVRCETQQKISYTWLSTNTTESLREASVGREHQLIDALYRTAYGTTF